MWTDAVGGADVRFEHEQDALDPFFNVNTPDELCDCSRRSTSVTTKFLGGWLEKLR